MTDAFKFHVGDDRVGEVFCARIRRQLTDKEDVLKALYYQLWLPWYFGFNWDALQECLGDLSWITEQKVIIIHEGLPMLPDDQLKIYLETLRDSALEWVESGGRTLEIVFPEGEKERIYSLIE